MCVCAFEYRGLCVLTFDFSIGKLGMIQLEIESFVMESE